jgi:uncharacterized protein YbaR (Trm112 family)
MSELNETVTLDDGSIVKVPGMNNMTDSEITSALIRALPGKMAGLGFLPNLEREYNIRDGVPDLNLRFQEALTNGNPKEVKAVFDDQVGKGNWGIEPSTQKPYVTAEGLRRLGIEPKDDRKVLLDGTSTDIYDLTADATREIAIGAAALGAELSLPIVPGSFLLGLAARSAAAGAGGSVASLGLEGIQELQGYNKESAVEVLKDAGTEGALIGAATFVLGAPFSAYGSIANRVKSAAKEVNPGEVPVKNTTVQKMIEAEQRVSPRVGKEDAMLLSVRTLVNEDGAIVGNLLSKMEGIGAKQAGDQFAARAANIVNKYRNTYLASLRAGDDEIVTLQKLKASLSKGEQDMLKKTVSSIKQFDETPLGKVGSAGETLRGFKNFAEGKLRVQYKAGQKAFDGDEYYGQFAAMEGRDVTNKELAGILNNIASKTDMLIDDVVDAFGPGNPLHSRITSRVEIKGGRVIPKRVTQKKERLEPGPNFSAAQMEDVLKSREPGRVADTGRGTKITAADFLEADRRMRKESYKTSDLNKSRINLNMSKVLLDEIEQKNLAPAGFRDKLKKVNKAYSEFAQVYRGKNGLFAQLAQRPQADAQKYLTSFTSGREGAEFSKMMDDLDKAFGPNAVGGKLGLDTRDEILSAIGINFIRENKLDIVNAAVPSVAAKNALKKINNIETTIKKQVGGGAKSKQATDQIFKGNVLGEYKKLLNDVANGRPAQVDKALAELGMTMSFREADQFVKSVNNVAMNLSKSDLNAFATQLRALEELSPDSAKFVRDMLFTDNYSRLFKAVEAQDPKAKLLGIKQWADDWTAATLNNAENMKYIFGKELFEGVDDFALNMKGALNIDPVAGALSVAENQVSIFRNVITGSIGALRKPLSFIFFTRQFAPGTAAHTKVVQGLQSGKTAGEITKEQSGAVLKMAGKAQNYAQGVMNARDGLVAASIASYLDEANQSYPTEDEIPTVMPQKIQMQQEAPQPQPQLQQQDGIAAIQQIAKMLTGLGESGISEGASMARGR